ncbi:RNA polymerase sigma-70 factor, Rhodopirellula/Verrucomicrobium family [Neorhodopirellula lusitana]|uniref:RNA polymerase sigma-70 factor, Rhodopirellula/Verrucomicrobium family n=1 Tax=Neorhodopirellula lusitana TaxID=445327 RepID=A0ABY1QQ96_9BACT|nr:sigma-70 family RNA polymerase sigma factor [Neorhodopirellula lusitana]SMP76022.1 RNA polymerase sigma-70 factor, Rhodopirellula/Verrucomicrobium family [Neorhodopirellula lusitana]
MTPSPSAADFDRQSEDYERFLDLFTTDRERIYGFIFSMLPNHADAEDVFQRCSIVLWRKLDQFTEGTSFYAWACSIAQFEVLNFRRSASRDRHYFSQELMEQLALERVEQRRSSGSRLEALQTCISRLGQLDRDLLGALYDQDRRLDDYACQPGRQFKLSTTVREC